MSGTTICEPILEDTMMNRYSLIPSFLVVFIVYMFHYHKEKKFVIIPPFLSLLETDASKKKMVAICFGAIFNSLVYLIVGTFKHDVNDPSWLQITISLLLTQVNIIVIVFINYPIFMCISSQYRLLASILGALFTVYRLVILCLSTFYRNCSTANALVIPNILENAPSMICYLILIFIFLKLTVRCIRDRNFGKIKEETTVAWQKDFQHVYSLLNQRKLLSLNQTDDETFYAKIRTHLSNLKKSFHLLSTVFVSALVVIGIFFYWMLISFGYLMFLLFQIRSALNNTENGKIYIELYWKPAFASVILSFGFTFVLYITILIKLIECHEKDLKDLFAGKKLSHSEIAHELSPRKVVIKNVMFPGYLSAYMFWGFLIFWLVTLTVIFFFSSIVNLIFFLKDTNLIFKILLFFLKYLYKIVLLPLLIYIFQWLLTKYVFCERNADSLTMVRNIKLYHMTIYVNFFYNLVAGIISCFTRSLKGLAISLVFMGRLDRSSFAFFKRFDNGYCSYLSYLRLEAVYKNPTMKCFVQMLHNSSREANPSDIVDVKKRARNRWHLVYTLVRNPSLKSLRVQHKFELALESNEMGFGSNRELLYLA